MTRGCVWGAWSWLCDHGHLNRAEGSSLIFDQLEESYRAVGTTCNETIAWHWLGHQQLALDFGDAS